MRGVALLDLVRLPDGWPGGPDAQRRDQASGVAMQVRPFGLRASSSAWKPAPQPAREARGSTVRPPPAKAPGNTGANEEDDDDGDEAGTPPARGDRGQDVAHRPLVAGAAAHGPRLDRLVGVRSGAHPDAAVVLRG